MSKILKPAPVPPAPIGDVNINLLTGAKLVNILQDSTSQNFWSQDALYSLKLLRTSKSFCFVGYVYQYLPHQKWKLGKFRVKHTQTHTWLAVRATMAASQVMQSLENSTGYLWVRGKQANNTLDLFWKEFWPDRPWKHLGQFPDGCSGCWAPLLLGDKMQCLGLSLSSGVEISAISTRYNSHPLPQTTVICITVSSLQLHPTEL